MSAVVEKGQTQKTAARRRLWTMADLAALPGRLPTGPAHYELWDGELRLTAPPGEIHGNTETRLTTVLTVHGEWEGLGRVTGGEAGILLGGDPDTVIGVDAAFFTADQLPVRYSPEGYSLTIPALMAEVRSRNDTPREVRERVERYLAAGACLVWVLDPVKRTVTAHRSGQEPQVLGIQDALTAEGIIPKLVFPVRRLFEGLE
jgi:Uma2 family endonuclease